MRVWWIVAGCLGVSLLAADPGGAQTADDDQRLAKLSAQAESPAQHARAAEEFRARAKALDREATRLERTARSLEKNWFPNEHKSPAPHRAGYTQRQRAAAARAAARDTRLAAARHEQLSAEVLAEP